MENLKNLTQTPINSFDSQEENGVPSRKFVISLLIIILVGVSAGFLLSTFNKGSSGAGGIGSKTDLKKSAGIADKKTFKDSAEGILKEGGIEGEGSFHLERPGGLSQNAYLTSSTVDLSLYVGKKVRVWGQTFQGQKAGWLMDVGLVEPIN